MLLYFLYKSHKLNYVLLVLAITFLGNVKAETSETPKNVTVNKTPAKAAAEQKSVKKELKVNITDEAIEQLTTPKEPDDHTEKLVIIDEKSVIETSGKALEQQPPPQPVDEEFTLNDSDDISDSLKTGFYFFLILSSGAIVFIVFKIYRLRLSRAERKYGVQGDRSTQELTPLPISIEDGHSDDEDQTLFEVQRQNIRIL
ncbi:hypothetical protein FF38_11545 [Lucilia cuprina]|uniref:Uncharacterized protein n=1 Tax=Lucilia cuprina TaxID=7375 RepID=A0A0L0CDH0_LUCCU|nr:hypothetical protein CVS40_2927 [Lucilia cuprina]KNC29519.1 hypothetical protein FF38_11545 [Lucilia cuprina]